MQPIYDVAKSYEENLTNPPKYPRLELSDEQRKIPVGVAAGPLLASAHVIAAIDAGANIVLYKTVRTRAHPCLPHPNCIGLAPGTVVLPGGVAEAAENRQDDKIRTNSFGMPSSSPEVWMPDVKVAVDYAAKRGRKIIVSVVGTPDPDAADQKAALAEDYAACAAMAAEAGAPAIELNLSCPNVRADLGAIYQSPEFAADIVAKAREKIGPDIPLYIKVGHFPDVKIMEAVVSAVAGAGVTGIVGINTISMSVIKPNSKTDENPNGIPALGGRPNAVSGVCGSGIAPFAEQWLRDILDIRKKLGISLIIGSSGGITGPEQFSERLKMGADMVFTASGFMSDPEIFIKFHKL